MFQVSYLHVQYANFVFFNVLKAIVFFYKYCKRIIFLTCKLLLACPT
jgi:hypothetical protein